MINDGPMFARQPWFRSRAVWAFIAFRFVPALAIFNAGWEIAQLPLYTLWYESKWNSIAFAVVHCTAGDVLIGTFALLLGLIATRAGPLDSWRFIPLTIVATTLAVGYTIFSEWMNTIILENWTYAGVMPLMPFLGTGIAPLLQWVIVPPVALSLVWPEVAPQDIYRG